ncbi:trihelix transcription factor ASIL1-like [Punica granatum]|uniref:Trihelix transcription factor ASIL1-like n=1 Tax=Punica granatum TaxID=22663 RepID=A0A218XQE4_PUNGR|nr:trihelix transcription factor ASIL1-like [Punica granatum]OWM87060.1 hypothetical protein CDL15_Pgr017645 [Punica granatum]
MGDLTESVTPLALPAPSHQPSPMPVREDCWSEEATSTLIDAWGRRHLELNRGNLRQKDWQEVADAVNALHGHSKKTHRTDVQCKNRIDTIKKKYKTEKARVSSSSRTLTSSWIFYDRMDALIGSSSSAKKAVSPSPSTSVSPLSPPMALPLPMSYKKTLSQSPAISLPQKRPADKMDEGYFRRNYSAVAAAAAAAEAEPDEDEEDDDETDEDEDEGEGMRRLAKAIERFGEVYERVEAEKLRQMVDLEKQRMQFAKDLEVQRLKMFMDTQVQLERIKHNKRSGSDDIYS